MTVKDISFSYKLVEWCDEKIDDLVDDNSKLAYLKAFGYGALSAIPDALSFYGAVFLTVCAWVKLSGKNNKK